MFATTPIRVFLLCAVIALLGFAGAAWTAGSPLTVLVGVVGAFAAAGAVVVEVENGEGRQSPEPL